MTMRKWATLHATVERWIDDDGRQRKRRVPAGAIFRDDQSGAMSVRVDVLPTAPSWSGFYAVDIFADECAEP